MQINSKIYPWLIIGLSFIFVAIGNWIYQPLSFDTRISTLIISIIFPIIGMAILPIIAIKYLFKKTIYDFGIFLPKEIKSILKTSFLITIINLPILWWLAQDESVQSYYRWINTSFLFFLFIGIILPALYFIAEEILFRGFLLFGIYNSNFKKHTILITTTLFAFFHFSKNLKEIIYSIFLSIVFCFISLKYKSFLPSAITHFLIALLLNIFINYFI